MFNVESFLKFILTTYHRERCTECVFPRIGDPASGAIVTIHSLSLMLRPCSKKSSGKQNKYNQWGDKSKAHACPVDVTTEASALCGNNEHSAPSGIPLTLQPHEESDREKITLSSRQFKESESHNKYILTLLPEEEDENDYLVDEKEYLMMVNEYRSEIEFYMICTMGRCGLATSESLTSLDRSAELPKNSNYKLV